MTLRQDPLWPEDRDRLEVVQITDDALPSCHVYMEAQIFTPDGKRFVLHTSAGAHRSDPRDPRHRYLLCDIDSSFSLSPLTDETGVTAPCLSPDGRQLYYFVDETVVGGGRLTLRRVGLDGTGREDLSVLDRPIPATSG